MVPHPMSSQSFCQFLSNIQSIDFGSLTYQLMYCRTAPQWTHNQTTRSIARYLMFLYLVDCYSNLQLVPPDDIDRVWHHHILDTQKYAEDCQQLFGYFIHHFPYLGTRGEGDRQDWHSAYALTQVLFRKQFGLDLGSVPADCEPLRHGYMPLMETGTVLLRPTVTVAIEEALQSLFDAA